VVRAAAWASHPDSEPGTHAAQRASFSQSKTAAVRHKVRLQGTVRTAVHTTGRLGRAGGRSAEQPECEVRRVNAARPGCISSEEKFPTLYPLVAETCGEEPETSTQAPTRWAKRSGCTG
jgi:hypothetical protein